METECLFKDTCMCLLEDISVRLLEDISVSLLEDISVHSKSRYICEPIDRYICLFRNKTKAVYMYIYSVFWKFTREKVQCTTWATFELLKKEGGEDSGEL